MSGDVIKEFLVSLGLQVDGAAGFDGAVNAATMSVAALGAVVVGAAGAMFAFTKTVADEFDTLSDLSALYNTTADSLQELGYVASLTDSSIEASNASIGALAKNAGDAALGLGRAGKTFDKLGIQVKDGNGKLKNSTDLLYEVGDAIKDMESGEQLSIMQRLGIDRTMLAAITTDVGGLREEFRKTYEAVGLDTNKAAEASSQFMDSITRLGFVTGAVGKSLAVTFMPRFTESMDKLRRLIVDNLPKIMGAIKPVISVVLSVADVFIALAYQAGKAVGVLIGWIVKINDATGGWALKILAAAAAWKYLNLSFLASPVGMIIALGAAIGLLLDDFQTWQEGGDSLIKWGEWENEIALATGVLDAFASFLGDIFTVIFASVDGLIKLITGDFSGAWTAASIGMEALGSMANAVFGPLLSLFKDEFPTAFYVIETVIGTVAAVIQNAFTSLFYFIDAAIKLITGDFSGALSSLKESFAAVADSLGRVFGPALELIKTQFSDAFAWIQSIIDGVMGNVKGAVDWVKGAAGGIGDAVDWVSGAAGSAVSVVPSAGVPPLAPSASSISNSSQSVNQSTQIIVQGSANPESTANAVAKQQQSVNGDMVRNMKGAAR